MKDVRPKFVPHFTERRRVEFADTDVAGIVHFSNFFRYVEAAEHAFFRSLGHRVHTVDGHRQEGWPRLEVSCAFHHPARFEQVLEIGLRVTELRTTSLRYEFAVSSNDKGAPTLVASGSCVIIYVAIDTASHTLRKQEIPTDLRAKLQSYIDAPLSS